LQTEDYHRKKRYILNSNHIWGKILLKEKIALIVPLLPSPPIIVPSKAILIRAGLQAANGFAFSTSIKGVGLVNSGADQHINQFGGIK
jgi:hypothetical protein